MCEQKIGCLPVVDSEENLLGLLTETDLVRAAYLENDDPGPSVELDDARPSIRQFSARFRDELAALRRTRDELRVQVHLAKADAQDQWHELEKQWRSLERHAASIAHEAQEPMDEAREVAADLAEELRRGYRRIRKSLSH
jgi:CBS domain-containing protein